MVSEPIYCKTCHKMKIHLMSNYGINPEAICQCPVSAATSEQPTSHKPGCALDMLEFLYQIRRELVGGALPAEEGNLDHSVRRALAVVDLNIKLAKSARAAAGSAPQAAELRERWARMYLHATFTSDPDGCPYKKYVTLPTEEFDEFNRVMGNIDVRAELKEFKERLGVQQEIARAALQGEPGGEKCR